MRLALITAAVLAVATASSAQTRHPAVEKLVELGVAGQIVSSKCAGWALNPELTAQLLTAIGLAGLTDQLEAVDAAEVSKRADQTMAEHWTSDRVAQQCAEATATTIPHPLRSGETVKVFVNRAP